MMRILVLLGICFVLGCDRGKKTVAPSASGGIDAKAVEANNRGVGLMGQFEFEKAIEIFEALSNERPEWEEVRVNLAMGYLNRQQEGDSQRAMKLLDEVMARKPDLLQARYCRGILLLNGGKPAEALGEFEFVAQKDPADAHAIYYVG